MIAIIDYDAGNLRSVEKAFEFIGAEAILTSDRETILAADAVVLPGVGAFRDCMQNLSKYQMEDIVRDAITRKKPFLGICLGFQMLFSDSEEHMENGIGVKGLGIYPGRVKKLVLEHSLKVPHMGWNNLDVKKDCPLLKGLDATSHVYFVHSFYVDSERRDIVSAQTTYGETFDVAMSDGMVFGTQFHPEKSGLVGLKMLENFTKVVKGV